MCFLLDVSLKIQLSILFDPVEELLGVTPDLSTASCPYMLLNLLPVFSKEIYRYNKDINLSSAINSGRSIIKDIYNVISFFCSLKKERYLLIKKLIFLTFNELIVL